ncbi:hypothetical protein BDN72DRAFT_906853 [Pluteus cervinus]|uniref:Uncharacterized protein n=1 Tax=Pluteus cervinus TaxID=181527 RepID=A0ACD2ZXZ6_9AGAR|nr:hypothetical protein BDN72DRAFT_906853 [Pluteus cervinus]
MAFSKEGHEIDASPFGFCVYGTVIKDNLAGFDPPTTFGDAFGALVMGPGETTSRRFNCSRNIMNDMQALLPLECKVCHCTGYVGPWEKRESRLYLTYLPTDGFRPRILAQDGTELPPDFNLTGKDVKAIFTLVNYAWAPQRMLALAVLDFVTVTGLDFVGHTELDFASLPSSWTLRRSPHDSDFSSLRDGCPGSLDYPQESLSTRLILKVAQTTWISSPVYTPSLLQTAPINSDFTNAQEQGDSSDLDQQKRSLDVSWRYAQP